MTPKKGLLRAVLLLLVMWCGVALGEVQEPHGEYFLNVDDLRVKVLGGEVKAGRTWYRGAWSFNREWSALRLELALDGTAGGSIWRNDSEYTRPSVSRKPVTLAGGVAGYHLEVSYGSADRKGERIIRRGDIAGGAPDALAERNVAEIRWEDTAGNWIGYRYGGGSAQTARIEAYGDRNGRIAGFRYDADGRLAGVEDRAGTQVLWYEYNGAGQLSHVRDADGRQVEYRYTGESLSEVIDVRGHGWQYAYAGGLLSSQIDPLGRTTEISYDTGKRVAKVVRLDSAGTRLETSYRFDYDKSRKEYYTQVRNPLGGVTESWYNSGSQLIRKTLNGVQTYAMVKDVVGGRESRTQTDRRGLKTLSEYDEWDNLIKRTYADGSRTSARYQAGSDRVLERIDELGRITRYAYDAKGNLTRLSEAVDTAQARITEYRYDENGLRIEKKVLGDGDTEEAITSYAYDEAGNLTQVTDPEGGVSRYSHNRRGDVLSRTDPSNQSWNMSYDAAGTLLSETDPLDRTVILGYDEVGNLISQRDARGHTRTYAYNLLDKRISQTDPLGHTAQLSYDGAGQLIALKDPLGDIQQLAYDLQGRLISQQDPAGNAITLGYGESAAEGGGLDGSTRYPGLLNRTQYPTYLQSYDYDQRDRRTRVIDHLDNGPVITVTEYDAAGNKTQTTDAEGRITQYRYDALDRLIEIIDPMNQSTRFGYDNRDNLIAVTDPNGHTTRYAYDKADRKTREIRPGGQIIAYTYDLAGRLSSSTDPDGRRSESRYDAAGQLSQQQHFAAGADTAERGVSYSYDANGNLSGYSDGTLGASYEYDENNRKTRESTDYGPFSLSHRYSYDAAGHKKTYTGPDDTAISYHWVKGQLSRIELPGEGSLYYNHYRWSEPDTISWPGGSRRQISYTADLKPTRLLDQDPGENPVLDTRYAYDATGNITQRATQSATYDYSYDALQRLSEAKSEAETEGWSYDPNGNRTSDNLNPGEWRYDDNDRLLESPAITYTYDEAGNTVSKTKGSTTTHYRYNAEGRLRRIEDQAQTLIADYQYDPLGRRIKKTTPAGSQYYHYSDEGLAGEYDATGAPIRQYGYRPEGTWMSEPLYQKTAQGYAYYQTDHLGSPQGLISKTGARVWRASYRAFGELAQESGPWANPLRFPGQYYDQETGLHYNYFRDYDPATGRYIQSDPIGLAGNDTNYYRYVFNNPIIAFDSTGEILPAVAWLARWAITKQGARVLGRYAINRMRPHAYGFAASLGAAWTICFNNCIATAPKRPIDAAIKLVCELLDVDKYIPCAIKCAIQSGLGK